MSVNSAQLRPRAFTRADQAAVRSLVLAGLADRFGWIDETMNPDLDDIWGSYVAKGGEVLVVESDGAVVATGTLLMESEEICRFVRMSVLSTMRGRGLGRMLVVSLLERARTRGFAKVMIETNDDWVDAIGLYLSCGFREIGAWDGDRHFEMDLKPNENGVDGP